MRATICLVPFNNPGSFIRILGQLSGCAFLNLETVIIDNSTNIFFRWINQAVCSWYSERLQLRYFRGHNKSLSSAINRAVELAYGKWFVYLCSNHTWIYDTNFMDYLCGEMEKYNADLGGTVSIQCRRHIQGGIFIAKRSTLKQIPFREKLFPMSFMDVDLSQLFEKLGKKQIHLEGMLSMMGKIPKSIHEEWLRTKAVKVCHSHFYDDMDWEEKQTWEK